MMSSLDHPTSNMEDAFSSNFPNYLPSASPDYIPTSPGKTYSSSSNSFGIVPLASPTLSLFHDDPYMKALQAFYTEKSPIPPPTIIPPSSIPNPQKFLSPKKQGRSSSSTSSLPQAFEIGESSRKTSIERHEEQIEEIMNYLGELSLDRIVHIEDKVEGLGKGRNASKRTSTSEAPAMTQAAIRKLVANSVIGLEDKLKQWQKERRWLIRWFDEPKTVFSHKPRCAEENKVTFSTGTLTDDALSWWNAYAQPMGEAINIAQRLMDQVTKLTPVQVSSDNKRKFDDRRTFNNNNNSRSNNNYRRTFDHELPKKEASQMEVIMIPVDQLYVMPVEKKGIIQISAKRPTSMPKEEPTC
ncbi:hypothetical protein Tco_0243240 [Tanacetum coccineum]